MKKFKSILTWVSDTEISKNMTKNVIQPCDPPNGGPLLSLSFIVHDIFPSFFAQFFLQNLSQFLGWKLFLSWAQVWCGGNGVARVELSWWAKEWKTSKLSREPPDKPSRGQESDGIPGKKTQHDIIMGIDPKELWARTTDRVTAEFWSIANIPYSHRWMPGRRSSVALRNIKHVRIFKIAMHAEEESHKFFFNNL